MICRDGSVGAAGRTAPTKGYEPPLKIDFVVVAVAGALLWRSILLMTDWPQPSLADPSPPLLALAGRAQPAQAKLCSTPVMKRMRRTVGKNLKKWEGLSAKP